MDKQLTNQQRLTETLSKEQLAGLLVGTLVGIAELRNQDGEEFVTKWTDSTINLIQAIVKGNK